MIKSLSIIPAAGRAERFGGCMKELLPISDDMTLLKRQVGAMQVEGGSTVVITSERKARSHREHLVQHGEVLLREQGNLTLQGAWAAILEGLYFEAERYYYAYPDVYMPTDWIADDTGQDFVIWVHYTDAPDRFGCLHHGQIHDKEFTSGMYTAYGALAWSKKVRDYWMDNIDNIKTHTDAFNMAMEEFGYICLSLDYYHDIASFKDYKELCYVL